MDDSVCCHPGETCCSASLSGLGQRTPLDYTAPVTTSEGQELDVPLFLMRSTFDPLNNHADPWGFPFHVACWELLKASSPTADIDLQALFDLCRSIPILEAGALHFGHDYGGPNEHHFINTLLWGIPIDTLDHDMYTFNRIISEGYELRQSDPLNANQITALAGHGFSAPPRLSYKTATTHDVFSKFPVELLDLILQELTLVDVLSLKLSSRVMANVTLSDRFWHSRFWHGRHFEFVFEFSQYTKYKGRWKDAFLSIRSKQGQPSLINRKRIWEQATRIHTVLAQIGSCHGTAIRSWFESDAPPDKGAWITASRCLRPFSSAFLGGSRLLYDRYLALPETLSSISISVIELLGLRYISGLRVTNTSGGYLDLGYFQSQKSVTLVTTCIVGFLLAQDTRGIRGIRVLSRNHGPSQWVGQHEKLPRRRLVLPRISEEDEVPIKKIRGGFDSDPEQYRPFEVGLFSDAAGRNLQHVNGIRTLKMQYSAEYDSISALRIDLHEPLRGHTSIYHGARKGDFDNFGTLSEYDFTINSTEGERIIGLDVNYGCRGYLIGIEVHTNFGRAGQLPPGHADDTHSSKRSTTRLWPETGHIVGFYGIVGAGSCKLVNLGIVCGGKATLKQFPPDASGEPLNIENEVVNTQ
ncbi:hypothetical protein NPX13_g9336 [Xylaria arbuscula]|uniref:F-box domain-containing protein n=1 Tax=Xylaria arbuscula TaxID=114810 RepID=A0A9W8THK4_9PEZI|nr:hypothetical protein NPX13_g9336 [Xylaria arbuscula]